MAKIWFDNVLLEFYNILYNNIDAFIGVDILENSEFITSINNNLSNINNDIFTNDGILFKIYELLYININDINIISNVAISDVTNLKSNWKKIEDNKFNINFSEKNKILNLLKTKIEYFNKKETNILDTSNLNNNFYSDNKEEINDYRLNSGDNLNNNLFFVNSGTGSGKTFTSQRDFILEIQENKENIGTHSFIYVAPQKNQLSINNTILNMATKNKIPVIYIRSRESMYYESISLQPIINGIKCKDNEDFFNKISSDLIYDKVSKLNDYYKFQKLFHLNKKSEKTNVTNYRFYDINRIISIYKENIANINNNHNENNNEDEFILNENRKKQINDEKYNFVNKIKQLSLFYSILLFYNKDSFKNKYTQKSQEEINKLFDSKDEVIISMLAFIQFANPIEIMKYKSCIALITAKKCTKTVEFMCNKLEKENYNMTIINVPFLNLLSGKSEIKCNISHELLKMYDTKDYELQIQNICNFLEEDSNINYFKKNNIWFNIFLDEEHKTYNVLEENDGKIDDNNVVDTLATVCRWWINICSGNNDEYNNPNIKNTLFAPRDNIGFSAWFEYNVAYNFYQNCMKSNLMAYEIECENGETPTPFKNINSFYKRFELIANSFGGVSTRGIVIDSSNKKSIEDILNNSIMTGKDNITNIDVLKNTYILLGKKDSTNSSVSTFYIKNNKEDGYNYITLYEFIMLIINLYDAFSKIPKTVKTTKDANGKTALDIEKKVTEIYGDLRKKTNTKYDNTPQDINAKSGYIIGQKNKNYFSGLLDDLAKQDIYINTFFTYFMKKMRFSLNSSSENENLKDDLLNKSVFFNIYINLYPPEVELLRLLISNNSKENFVCNNKSEKIIRNNTVTVASATRGFPNIYNGNYNLLFFEKINKIYIANNLIAPINIKNICDNNNSLNLCAKRFEYLDNIDVVRMKISYSHNENGKRATIKYKNEIFTIKDGKNYNLNKELIKNNNLNLNINYSENIYNINIDENESNGLFQLSRIVEKYLNEKFVYSDFERNEVRLFFSSLNDMIFNKTNGFVIGLKKTWVNFLNCDCKKGKALWGGENKPDIIVYDYIKSKKENKSCYNYNKDYENNIYVKDFIKSVDFLSEENRSKCILLFPYGIKNLDYSIKIFAFDSALGNDEYFEHNLSIVKGKQNVMIGSCYVSSGTGLNNVVKQKKEIDSYLSDDIEERDFEAMYIISSPYWSQVKNPIDGYIHSSNYNNIFRHLSDLENSSKKLSDLDIGIDNGEFLKILEDEHYMENVKDIIQACGRIERRNYKQNRKIIFCNNENFKKNKHDTFLRVMESFKIFDSINEIEQEKYEKLSKGFSVNTRSLIAVNRFFMKNRILTDNEQLQVNNIYENLLKSSNELLENKNCLLIQWLSECRKNNDEYKFFLIFNNCLRNVKTQEELYNLSQLFIKKIRKYNQTNKIKIQFNENIEHIFTKYINDLCLYIYEKGLNLDFLKEKSLAIDSNKLLTSVKIGTNPINEKNVYGYNEVLENFYNKNNNLASINICKEICSYINKFNEKLSETKIEYIPVGNMFDILKGNRAEFLIKLFFDKYIIENKVDTDQYKNFDEYADLDIQYALCERFDLAYIDIKNKKILCIDVKNMRLNKQEYIDKTLDINSILNRKLEILKYFENYKIEYIFINVENKSIVNNELHRLLKNEAKYFTLFSFDEEENNVLDINNDLYMYVSIFFGLSLSKIEDDRRKISETRKDFLTVSEKIEDIKNE